MFAENRAALGTNVKLAQKKSAYADANTVLGKTDHVHKRLQDPTMNFKEAATDIESLQQEFVKFRNDLSQAAVENA